MRDGAGISDIHIRSERLVALRKCWSLSSYKSDALKEEAIILEVMGGTLGPLLDPYINYIEFKVLTERRRRNSDDIFDFGGTSFININIRKLNTMQETVRFVILPELITVFIMEKHQLCYKDASKFIYGDIFPTTHHVNMLVQV